MDEICESLLINILQDQTDVWHALGPLPQLIAKAGFVWGTDDD